jgi:hypothetical protein
MIRKQKSVLIVFSDLVKRAKGARDCEMEGGEHMWGTQLYLS